MSDNSKPYSVLYFGEHPDDTNECHTGFDFATLAEAEAFIATDPLADDSYHRECTQFIVIDGPDLPDLDIRPNPYYVEDRPDYGRSEYAMQAGMMGGVGAYNDARGYDSEPYDPDIHDRYEGYGEPY